MSARLPIVVFAGADRQPSRVPPQLAAADMLAGFKGAHALPGGRTLLAEMVERVKSSGRFLDPVVVGPRRIYEGKVDAEIVDTEGSLAVTLRAAMRVVRRRFDPTTPVALAASDILPTPEELCGLLDTAYEPHRECMFWWQIVEAEPEAMGASHWKPNYRLRPDAASPPQHVYPGHLVIVRPHALRIGLTSSLLELSYRYRNRDLRQRYLPLLIRSSGRLMAEDLRNLFSGQLPILTFALPYWAIWAYSRVRRQQLTLADFEHVLTRILLHRKYHHAAGNRPVAISLTPILSLAKDIDTQAELTEAASNKA